MNSFPKRNFIRSTSYNTLYIFCCLIFHERQAINEINKNKNKLIIKLNENSNKKSSVIIIRIGDLWTVVPVIFRTIPRPQFWFFFLLFLIVLLRINEYNMVELLLKYSIHSLHLQISTRFLMLMLLVILITTQMFCPFPPASFLPSTQHFAIKFSHAINGIQQELNEKIASVRENRARNERFMSCWLDDWVWLRTT